MNGSARESAAGLRSRLDARRDDPGLAALPAELFAVADVISGDSQLRAALADAGQPAQARVALARRLFATHVSELTSEVVDDIVTQKWSSPRDLADAVEQLAAQSAFIAADAADGLEQVESELFAFSQAVDGSADLQMALTDPAVGPAQKASLIGTLARGRMSANTEQVLGYMMGHLRGRRVSAVMDAWLDLAAEQRNRSVAEVRVARPLQAKQAKRLAAALSRLHGRDVRLNVAVDPGVIGGISVRIGDEVTDATVATRLEQARRALVG